MKSETEIFIIKTKVVADNQDPPPIFKARIALFKSSDIIFFLRI